MSNFTFIPKKAVETGDSAIRNEDDYGNPTKIASLWGESRNPTVLIKHLQHHGRLLPGVKVRMPPEEPGGAPKIIPLTTPGSNPTFGLPNAMMVSPPGASATVKAASALVNVTAHLSDGELLGETGEDFVRRRFFVANAHPLFASSRIDRKPNTKGIQPPTDAEVAIEYGHIGWGSSLEKADFSPTTYASSESVDGLTMTSGSFAGPPFLKKWGADYFRGQTVLAAATGMAVAIDKQLAKDTKSTAEYIDKLRAFSRSQPSLFTSSLTVKSEVQTSAKIEELSLRPIERVPAVVNVAIKSAYFNLTRAKSNVLSDDHSRCALGLGLQGGNADKILGFFERHIARAPKGAVTVNAGDDGVIVVWETRDGVKEVRFIPVDVSKCDNSTTLAITRPVLLPIVMKAPAESRLGAACLALQLEPRPVNVYGNAIVLFGADSNAAITGGFLNTERNHLACGVCYRRIERALHASEHPIADADKTIAAAGASLGFELKAEEGFTVRLDERTTLRKAMYDATVAISFLGSYIHVVQLDDEHLFGTAELQPDRLLSSYMFAGAGLPPPKNASGDRIDRLKNSQLILMSAGSVLLAGGYPREKTRGLHDALLSHFLAISERILPVLETKEGQPRTLTMNVPKMDVMAIDVPPTLYAIHAKLSGQYRSSWLPGEAPTDNQTVVSESFLAEFLVGLEALDQEYATKTAIARRPFNADANRPDARPMSTKNVGRRAPVGPPPPDRTAAQAVGPIGGAARRAGGPSHSRGPVDDVEEEHFEEEYDEEDLYGLSLARGKDARQWESSDDQGVRISNYDLIKSNHPDWTNRQIYRHMEEEGMEDDE